jgi:tetratricopeptide (TPR) repeat protein
MSMLRSKAVRNFREEADKARDERRWRDAAQLYRAYLTEHPDDFAIWVQCGHAQKESGEFDLAEQCYITARRISGADADLHLQIGHLYKLMGRFGDAARSYQRCLELNATLVDAATELRALEREGRVPVPGGSTPPGGLRENTTFKGPPAWSLQVRAEVIASEEALLRYVRRQNAPTRLAVLLRAYLRLSPTDGSRWLALADTFDQLGEDNQALRCRRIAEALATKRGGENNEA